MESLVKLVAENGELVVAVALATMAGVILLLIRNRTETPTMQWRNRPIGNLTQYQINQIFAAKQCSEGLMMALKANEPDQKAIWQEAKDCFWHIVFSHFKAPDALYEGYYLDLKIPEAIERANRLVDDVLIPKLIEIAEELDPRRKGLLTCRYMHFLRAGVFDPYGGVIRYDILMEVMGADYHTDRLQMEENLGAFMLRLGFQARNIVVNGVQLRQVFYWPQRVVMMVEARM